MLFSSCMKYIHDGCFDQIITYIYCSSLQQARKLSSRNWNTLILFPGKWKEVKNSELLTNILEEVDEIDILNKEFIISSNQYLCWVEDYREDTDIETAYRLCYHS